MTYSRNPNVLVRAEALCTPAAPRDAPLIRQRAHLMCIVAVHLTDLRGAPPTFEPRRTPNERVACGVNAHTRPPRLWHDNAMPEPAGKPVRIFARPGSHRVLRLGCAAPDAQLHVQHAYPGEIGGGRRRRFASPTGSVPLRCSGRR
jgi:hypothetical protein